MWNRSSVLGTYYQSPPETGAEGTELVKNSAMKWVRWIDADTRSPDNPFRGRQRVLARLYMKDAIEATYMERGAEGAVEYANLMRPRIERLKEMGIFDVGGPNEPHPTKATAPAYDAFQYKLTGIYYGWDMKYWGWDWGVGWMGLRRFGDQDKAHIGMVEQCAGSVNLMRQAGGGLSVHEYNAPSPINPDGNNENSRTLRILHALVELARAGVDVDNLRVIIGECGIDRGVLPGQSPAGWMSFKSWVYPPQYGLPSGCMTDERYWLQMSALDDEYVKIKQIEAAFPFITNPWSGDWQSFNWPGTFIRKACEKHARPVTPQPDPDQPALAPVHAYLDRLPFSRKAAIALGLEFLDEVQINPTEYAAVCVDRKKGKYVALPVKLMGSVWMVGNTIVLERGLTE
jgi:hypothetical protein